MVQCSPSIAGAPADTDALYCERLAVCVECSATGVRFVALRSRGPLDSSDEDRRVNELPPMHGAEGWRDALRRRKVVQWGILYVAGAWSFLQGFEFLSDTYGWPLQLQRLATLALLIGLPIVLVVAWYHGDRGHQRVTTAEFAIITLLLLIGGGALAFYQRNSDRSGEAAPAARGTSDPPASSTAGAGGARRRCR